MASLSGDRQLIAWAAGLYDGEGSCSAYLPRRRHTYRRQMAVSQGGDPGKPPLVLLGFKAAVGGAGNITGPYNGYLFYWKTTQIHALDEIAATLWPFLGPEKRDQFLVASRLAGKAVGLDSTAPRETTDETERAWAAGFFDGEGTISVGGSGAAYPRTVSLLSKFHNPAITAYRTPCSDSSPSSGAVPLLGRSRRGTHGVVCPPIDGRSAGIETSKPWQVFSGSGSAPSSGRRSTGPYLSFTRVCFEARTQVAETGTPNTR